MSNAIPSHAQGNGNPAAAGTSSADWLARLMADRGTDGQGTNTANNNANSFARWMAQHTPAAQPQAAAKPTTEAAAAPRNAATASPTARPANAASTTGTRAQVPSATAQAQAQAQAKAQTQAQTQAQAKARADVRAEASKASQSAAQRADQQATQAAMQQAKQRAHMADQANQADQAERNRPARGDVQAKPASGTQASGEDVDKTTAEARAEKQPSPGEDTRFTTAAGEGTAIVRELTPPPHVQTNDPAGMMAWLASLTQSGADAPQDGGTSLQPGEGEGSGRGLTLGRDDDGRSSGRGRGTDGPTTALGRSGAASLGDDARGDAALQADALLGRGRDTQALASELLRAPGAGSEAAALLAAEGARGATFSQALGEARGALPHAQASLPTPLDAPEFTQKLADQVSLWVGQARSDGPMTAELHLNPAEMGPINVKISLDGASARVDFAAAALETRQAIEASLSQLSSSLSDVGLSLTGGGVSSQTSQQQQQAFAQGAQGNAQSSTRAGQGDGEGEGDEGNDGPLGLRQVSAPRSGRLGGLDLYA